jgi:hypothetical protein
MKKILVLVLALVIVLVAGFSVTYAVTVRKCEQVIETVDVEDIVQCYVDHEYGEYYHADNITEYEDTYGYFVCNPDREWELYCFTDMYKAAKVYAEVHNI